MIRKSSKIFQCDWIWTESSFPLKTFLLDWNYFQPSKWKICTCRLALEIRLWACFKKGEEKPHCFFILLVFNFTPCSLKCFFVCVCVWSLARCPSNDVRGVKRFWWIENIDSRIFWRYPARNSGNNKQVRWVYHSQSCHWATFIFEFMN